MGSIWYSEERYHYRCMGLSQSWAGAKKHCTIIVPQKESLIKLDLYFQDTSEEVDRLKREILRYRMELSNRESNFNRMFTEKQPVFVNQNNRRQSRRLSNSSSEGGMPSMRYASCDSRPPFPLPNDVQYSLDSYDEVQITEMPVSFFANC